MAVAKGPLPLSIVQVRASVPLTVPSRVQKPDLCGPVRGTLVVPVLSTVSWKTLLPAVKSRLTGPVTVETDLLHLTEKKAAPCTLSWVST